MEHNNAGLEDDIPFQRGEFLGSMLIFWGVIQFSGAPLKKKTSRDFSSSLPIIELPGLDPKKSNPNPP